MIQSSLLQELMANEMQKYGLKNGSSNRNHNNNIRSHITCQMVLQLHMRFMHHITVFT